ncbi:MAG: tRNA (adenosine(37)-N6)-threonylcarbamoyltransferase complex dimerization subunit type 1 TsaB [Bdellovibrionaceae bacterium]|jgi:tRNA threonylcarbamoyladenosine biosynthesis protein TsaB|nr:tRNA (adenosine(37)-N6)-threonylcarbamoyltransferase complex dimerization subunit type 1 TsaB [Pseudobdellovibrionaceae bacterium]
MIILTVETSTPTGSLSLVDTKTQVEFHKSWSRTNNKSQAKNSHSEALTIIFQEALNHLKASPNKIDLLVSTIGPGSFTGIRVAINFIKTLSFTCDIPIIQVNSLKALSLNALYSPQAISTVTCLQNAQKNSVFFAQYSLDQNKGLCSELLSPRLITIQQLNESSIQPTLCLGDGLNIYSDFLDEGIKNSLLCKPQLNAHPQTPFIHQYVHNNLESLKKIRWPDLSPLYLKGSEAEENQKRGLLKPLPQF